MPGSNPDEKAARPPALLLGGAALADGRRVDVRLAGPRIEAVGTVGSLAGAEGGAACERIDLTGYLLLPAPAEPHGHWDAAFEPEELERFEEEPRGGADLVQRRVVEGALTALGYGATAQRTHVRVGDVHGLARLEAVLEAARVLRGRGLVELQAIAVPRLLTGRAGAEGRAQLREAVKAGALGVGGCPELDPDPAGYVDELLSVAGEFGCAVDLHLDGGEPARLVRLASALGSLRPRVAVGPVGGLGRLDGGEVTRCAAGLAAAGVRVVCLPQSGTCVGNAGAGALGGLPVSVVARALGEAGVVVAAGGGGLRDAANPVGRADPLEAAFLLASTGAFAPEAAYAAVSGRAREVLGLPPVRVDAGFPAELLAVRGESLAAVLSAGHSRVVVHRGRVVCRTSAVREFAEGGEGAPSVSAPSGGGGVPRQGGGAG